jgi:hypothetical protein
LNFSRQSLSLWQFAWLRTYDIITHMPTPTSLQRPHVGSEQNSGQQKNKFLIIINSGWSTFRSISHCLDNKYGFSKRSLHLILWILVVQCSKSS